MKLKYLLSLLGLSFLLAVPDASALSSYQSRVPNGTVSSCDTCHNLVSGPPNLNPFGSAFRDAGLRWTPALAVLDSDGDGFSNGRELGDPAGSWTAGTPNPTGTITNPGDPASHPATATAPAITTQPVSQTVTAGANVTFTVAATGTAPLTYQWQKDTVNITGATSASLMLTGVIAGDAGSYRAVVSNAAGTATSDAATLTVNPAPAAPSITMQPTSQAVMAGADVTFTVAATGTAPLTYQWQKNTVNITGATSASLMLTSVTAGDAGSYRAVVSNTAGTATSDAATLTVNPAPVAPAITTQPASQTVMVGANVTLSVVATGTAPLSYQWQKDTVNIPAATNDTLVLNSVLVLDAGSYRVIVTNIVGSATSDEATITVNTAPVAPEITTQPASQDVPAGGNATFTVVATGTAPLAYQWQKDTANITGATSATLTLTGVTAGDAGSYRVVVTNSVGSATSEAAILTVNTGPVAPVITTQPTSQTVLVGADVSFKVVATGTAPLSYQWQKDTVNIAGATGDTLALTGVVSGDAGSYRVVVSNAAGSATSDAATLTVNTQQENVPPAVQIIQPREGRKYFSGREIRLLALASDSDGTVTEVEFFDGETSLGVAKSLGRRHEGEDGENHPAATSDDDSSERTQSSLNGVSALYSIKWDNASVGDHTITAKATDNLGASTVSAPVKITVTSKKPRGSDHRESDTEVTESRLEEISR